MPIFEFKCLKCSEFFEVLVMSKDEDAETKCPKCGSEEFERVLSATNHAIAGGSGAGEARASTQTRNCSAGNCTTYTIPGEG